MPRLFGQARIEPGNGRFEPATQEYLVVAFPLGVLAIGADELVRATCVTQRHELREPGLLERILRQKDQQLLPLPADHFPMATLGPAHASQLALLLQFAQMPLDGA